MKLVNLNEIMRTVGAYYENNGGDYRRLLNLTRVSHVKIDHSPNVSTVHIVLAGEDPGEPCNFRFSYCAQDGYSGRDLAETAIKRLAVAMNGSDALVIADYLEENGHTGAATMVRSKFP